MARADGSPSLRRILARLAATACAVAIAGFTACGGIEPEDGEASLRVALASASGCGYTNVHVTIDSVQVHESPLATGSSLGWRVLRPDGPRRVDLMTLDNGVLAALGSTSLPTGRYRQLRLVLAPNTAEQPLRNSVTAAGQGEVALAMPAAQQSGLVLRIDRDLAADEALEAVLDFDACNSVVPLGTSGGYLLDPVVRILPWPAGEGSSVAGRIDDIPATGARVSLQQAGRVMRSTVPDADGRFLLAPAPPGTHDLVIVAEGRANTVLAQVPVSDAGRTAVVADAEPIGLVTSAMRTVSGRIALLGTGAIPAARASALQAVGMRVIEAESRPVDALDGSYAMRLPVAPPMLATYDPDATGYSPSPDIGQAAKYGIEAAVPGRAVQTVEVDIGASDAVANFDFAP